MNNRSTHSNIMTGQASTWFIRKYGYTNKALPLFMAIVDQTFGYRKRYAYIKADTFGLSKATLKKHRDFLVEEGILKWNTTRGYVRYELKIQEVTENFIFADGSRSIHEEDTEPSVEVGGWNGSVPEAINN